LKYNLTDIDLLEQLLFATSGSQTYRVFDSVRLKSIELFSASSTNRLHTVSVEWLRVEPYGSKTQTVSDTAVGVTEPAHVRAMPPKDSYAHSWLSPDSTPRSLAVLSLPFDTVIDITVQYVINLNSSGVVANYTGGSSVPAGSMFVPTIYGVLIPQSVNN